MPILSPEERLGTTLAGKYELKRILGRGGMGVVYESTHSWTGREVAVKLLHPSYVQDDTHLGERFLQEARTATAVRHPNVVEVLDMGSEPDGTVYLVLELLDGEPLTDRMKQGPMSPTETVNLLLPVMDALASAHDKGFIHRDLKPDNILLHHRNHDIVPKVLDFGIAKVLQEGAGNMTKTGVVVGTPHYISPEQAMGESTVGPPTDVWAMGVVAFECLSGTVPFDADSPTAIVIRVCTQRAPPVAAQAPNIHPLLAQAVDRALVREPEARYPDMRAFALALIAACRSAGVPFEAPKGLDPMTSPDSSRSIPVGPPDGPSYEDIDVDAALSAAAALPRQPRDGAGLSVGFLAAAAAVALLGLVGMAGAWGFYFLGGDADEDSDVEASDGASEGDAPPATAGSGEVAGPSSVASPPPLTAVATPPEGEASGQEEAPAEEEAPVEGEPGAEEEPAAEEAPAEEEPTAEAPTSGGGASGLSDAERRERRRRLREQQRQQQQQQGRGGRPAVSSEW